jgi:hypothetical protein
MFYRDFQLLSREDDPKNGCCLLQDGKGCDDNNRTTTKARREIIMELGEKIHWRCGEEERTTYGRSIVIYLRVEEMHVWKASQSPPSHQVVLLTFHFLDSSTLATF